MMLFQAPGSDQGPLLVVPGAVHLPGRLDPAQRRLLVEAFGTWVVGPVPIRAASLPGGRMMSVQTVCLGWHWQPYRYTRTAGDVNGKPVLPLPGWLIAMGRSVLADAYSRDAARRWHPDTALVNFYDDHARLGMHQDNDEVVNEPVVSLSVGATCTFRFGNTENRTKPWTDIALASGDAFVFGRESRFAFHGVPKIHPGTADPASGLASGRINVTMRVTGLR
jgi:alkylated DNA repair protein (DNA oxidative demethylase)